MQEHTSHGLKTKSRARRPRNESEEIGETTNIEIGQTFEDPFTMYNDEGTLLTAKNRINTNNLKFPSKSHKKYYKKEAIRKVSLKSIQSVHESKDEESETKSKIEEDKFQNHYEEHFYGQNQHSDINEPNPPVETMYKSKNKARKIKRRIKVSRVSRK